MKGLNLAAIASVGLLLLSTQTSCQNNPEDDAIAFFNGLEKVAIEENLDCGQMGRALNDYFDQNIDQCRSSMNSMAAQNASTDRLEKRMEALFDKHSFFTKQLIRCREHPETVKLIKKLAQMGNIK